MLCLSWSACMSFFWYWLIRKLTNLLRWLVVMHTLLHMHVTKLSFLIVALYTFCQSSYHLPSDTDVLIAYLYMHQERWPSQGHFKFTLLHSFYSKLFLELVVQQILQITSSSLLVYSFSITALANCFSLSRITPSSSV